MERVKNGYLSAEVASGQEEERRTTASAKYTRPTKLRTIPSLSSVSIRLSPKIGTREETVSHELSNFQVNQMVRPYRTMHQLIKYELCAFALAEVHVVYSIGATMGVPQNSAHCWYDKVGRPNIPLHLRR